ncbi:MAG: hypothetical protein IJ763_09010 [Lachnospiraceae bacterium]|nr:hypothetical protein [Lachnospiraceae bacterium]
MWWKHSRKCKIEWTSEGELKWGESFTVCKTGTAPRKQMSAYIGMHKVVVLHGKPGGTAGHKYYPVPAK